MQHCLPTGLLTCDRTVISRRPLNKFAQVGRPHRTGKCLSKSTSRCNFKPETQRQTQSPSAPPVRIPPPPPPPPPQQPTATAGPSRRTLFAILLGGSLLSYAARKSTEPQFYKDKYGIPYLKTDKGNPVAVTADKRGNIMMIDKAGNLYYDAGSPQLGIYMVSMKGDLYNLYQDTHGEQQTALLGNVKDLRTIKVKEIAGVPIEKLQAHYEIQRNRAGKKDGGMPDRIVGFPDQTRVPLPPGTVNVYKDGKDKVRLEGPAVLDEGRIDLEEKKNLWPFTQIEPGGGKFHRGIE